MALLPKINMLTSNLVTVVQKIISSLMFSLGLECYSYLTLLSSWTAFKCSMYATKHVICHDCCQNAALEKDCLISLFLLKSAQHTVLVPRSSTHCPLICLCQIFLKCSFADILFLPSFPTQAQANRHKFSHTFPNSHTIIKSLTLLSGILDQRQTHPNCGFLQVNVTCNYKMKSFGVWPLHLRLFS